MDDFYDDGFEDGFEDGDFTGDSEGDFEMDDPFEEESGIEEEPIGIYAMTKYLWKMLFLWEGP